MNQRPLPPQGSALPTAPHPDTTLRIISQKHRLVNTKNEKISKSRYKYMGKPQRPTRIVKVAARQQSHRCRPGSTQPHGISSTTDSISYTSSRSSVPLIKPSSRNMRCQILRPTIVSQLSEHIIRPPFPSSVDTVGSCRLLRARAASAFVLCRPHSLSYCPQLRLPDGTG